MSSNEEADMKITTIRSRAKLVKRIRAFQITSQETNEEILIRMLNFIELMSKEFKQYSIGALNV